MNPYHGNPKKGDPKGRDAPCLKKNYPLGRAEKLGEVFRYDTKARILLTLFHHMHCSLSLKVEILLEDLDARMGD